jgi:hypothetical protein
VQSPRQQSTSSGIMGININNLNKKHDFLYSSIFKLLSHKNGNLIYNSSFVMRKLQLFTPGARKPCYITATDLNVTGTKINLPYHGY